MAKKGPTDVDRVGRLDHARRAQSDNDVGRLGVKRSKRERSPLVRSNGSVTGTVPQINGHAKMNGHTDINRYNNTSLHAPTPVRHLPPHYNRPTNVLQTPPLSSILRPTSSRSATTSRFNTPEQTSDESDTLFRSRLNGSQSETTASFTTAIYSSTARPRAGRWSSTTSLSRLTGSSTPLSFLPAANVEGALRPSIVPTYEYYGFALYLSSTLLFILYLVWGILGADTLEALQQGLRIPSLSQLATFVLHPLKSIDSTSVPTTTGQQASNSSRRNDYAISLPSEWWALAVPSWLVILLGYTYVALACWNIQRLTPSFSDRRTMTDGYANVCDGRRRHRDGHRNATKPMTTAPAKTADRETIPGWRHDEILYDTTIDQWTKGTNGVLDLPPSVVSLALYGDVSDDEESWSDGDVIEDGYR